MPKPKTTYEQAVADTKQLNKLIEHNAINALTNVMAPSIKRQIKEALSEGDDEPDTDVAPAMPEDDEMEEADGADSKATIDLDKLSAEMEDEVRQEAEGEDLDLDIEDEPEEPMAEAADDMEDEEIEVSDEEVTEAFNDIMKEFNTPPKGDPDLIDPNTGKAEGLANSQKQQTDKPWDEVDPPDKEDFTKKESYYHRIIAVEARKLAESRKQVKHLAGKIQEMKLDHAKLAYISNLFNGVDVPRNVKTSVIARFDEAKTVREAKMVYESAKSVLSRNKKVTTESRKPRSNRRPVASNAGSVSSSQSQNLREHSVAPRWKELANLK